MLFSYWHKLYQEKESNKELEEENRILKKELQFLKDEMNSKCSKNDKYEIARRYLLGCITFREHGESIGHDLTSIIINVSELFKIFNIPFDSCLNKYQKEKGQKLLMEVELKIEEPSTIMMLSDINIDEVITKEILDELMKEQNNEENQKKCD